MALVGACYTTLLYFCSFYNKQAMFKNSNNSYDLNKETVVCNQNHYIYLNPALEMSLKLLG